jgi:hypothetical protein
MRAAATNRENVTHISIRQKMILREVIERRAAVLHVDLALAAFESKGFVVIAEPPLQETSLWSLAGMARSTVNPTKAIGTGRDILSRIITFLTLGDERKNAKVQTGLAFVSRGTVTDRARTQKFIFLSGQWSVVKSFWRAALADSSLESEISNPKDSPLLAD